ncbi:MAG: hypothetical protein U9O95_02955 [Candidatus Marinimicrobia bacterium]|nr:hypothetical protein [Candidatus Neomarinimicrobiota bacterium]
MKLNKDFFKLVFTIVVTIVTLFGAIIGVIFLINGQVKEQVKRIASSDQFLEELSSKINPYMIFNENNSILVDMGGGKYINEIIVEKDTFWAEEVGEITNKITIIPNQLLSTAPLLKCIDSGDTYTIKVERGPKFNWIYTLDLSGDMIFPRPINKFRIDIIP